MSQSKEVIVVQGWDDTDQTAFIKEPTMTDRDIHKLASDILVFIYKNSDEEIPNTLLDNTLNTLKEGIFDKIKQFLVGVTNDGLLNTNIYDDQDNAHNVNFTMTRLPIGNR